MDNLTKMYEAMLIIDSNLDKDKKQEVVNRIQEIIKKNTGSILSFQELGKQKLGYEVKGHKEGIYLLINFKADPLSVDKIKKIYVIDDDVLKHLILLKQAHKEQVGKKE